LLGVVGIRIIHSIVDDPWVLLRGNVRRRDMRKLSTDCARGGGVGVRVALLLGVKGKIRSRFIGRI